MKLLIATGILLLQAAPAPARDTVLSVADARADFDVLRSALEEAHGGLYRFATKAEVGARFETFKSRLVSPMPTRAFAGMIAELLATTRDGHMRLEYDSATTASLASARLFPLRVVVEGTKLVVLLDGGTFSTAADVTATLHHLGRAIFVGEESAGGYEGNTSGLNALVVLPRSGLRLKIMMYDYWNAVSPRTKGRGTLPDVVVERRVADLIRGVDPQMDRAIALARP